MNPPFTTEQFLDVFRQYNQAIYPAQIAAYLLGVAAVALASVRRKWADRAISAVLAAFWLLMGAGYHIGFFSSINKAAYAFGGMFVLQGLLFAWTGAVRGRPRFGFRRDAYGLAGGILVLYAMLVYPLLGAQFGHAWPESPVFGAAPCPTTIFTFGILLFASGRVPAHLIVIPAIWSVIGFMAAINWGIREDTGLLAAGAAGVTMILARNRRLRRAADEGTAPVGGG